MNFVTYEMQAVGRYNDNVDNIRIIISDALSGEVVGDARLTDFDNFWVELPEVTGRFKLKAKAIKELHKHFIESLDDLYHKAWLVDNGGWLMNNLEKR